MTLGGRGLAGLRIELLGTPAVEVDGEPLAVDTRKAIALLACLAIAGPQGRAPAAALLWPELDTERARGALRRTLSTLRRALGGRWLVAGPDRLELKGPNLWCDTAELAAAVAQARADGHEAGACERCAPALERAAELYRGDLLAGFSLRDSPAFDDWAYFEAERARGQVIEVLDRLVAHLAQRAPGRAVELAHRRLALDPLHEPAYRTLMRLETGRGNRAEARRLYRVCARVLDEELGVAPLPETTALYEAIVAGAALPGDERAARARPVAAELPLVERDHELAALRDLYRSAAQRGRLAYVEGEAGIGKTRLVHALVSELGRGRALVARANAQETDLPFAAVSTWLGAARPALQALPAALRAEVARVLPDLGDEPPAPRQGEADRVRLLAALASALAAAVAGDAPGLLLLEDAQWCDAASLDVLGYLVRRLEGERLLVVVTWRSEEVAGDHPLARLARTVEPDLRLPLARLSEDAVAALSDAAGLSEPVARARLWRESEGLPLFVVEYLAALAAGELDPSWAPVGGIRALLRSRCAGVSEHARQALAAAAVLSGSFGFDLWRATAGRGEDELVAAAEELVALGLLRESAPAPGEIAFSFSHDKLREVVYGDTSAARRRSLHRRAAEALLDDARRRGEPPAHASIARHLRRARADARAAEHFELAALQAAALYAHAEAIEHTEQALALGHPEPARLHRLAGDARLATGDYGRALDAYRAAAAAAAEPEWAALEHRLGTLYLRRGEPAGAEAHLDAALELLDGSGDLLLRARVLADKALARHLAGDPGGAAAIAGAALGAAGEAGDDRVTAQAHNILGIVSSAAGDLERAAEHLGASLERAEASGDPAARAAALNNLALLRAKQGRPVDGLALARQALELARRTADRHREAALLNTIADLLRASGQRAEALEHVKLAAAAFAEVGEEGRLLPEIWKLVEW